MKPIQTSNANARQYVQRCEPFDGHNTLGRLFHPNSNCLTYRYVVFSYGTHYPMFIAEWHPEDGKVQWYVNTDNYSITTSKHRTQLHPLQQVMPMNTDTMQVMVKYGIAGVAAGAEVPMPF